MVEEELKFHYLLEKQLKRTNLTEEDITPDKRQAWVDLLSRINRSYLDHEQERYLLERSMEISSREMMELNDKLEYAQEIAHLGYWQYDRVEEKILWSKETYHLTGIDPAQGVPKLEEIMHFVHEDDREKLAFYIERAFNEGKDYEIELRFKNQSDGLYHWQYAKGHPHINANNEPIRFLSGIAIDITSRKEAEENIKKIHQQLLSISRQAGMAEVATSILHNIGNILNSANTSITLLNETLSKSRMPKLIKISEMIKEHLDKNDDYLKTDPNGKLIPEYLVALSQSISDESQQISQEISRIQSHLNHIKDIVALQRDISGVAGVKESIQIEELMNEAIQLSIPNADSKKIKLEKNYLYNKNIMSEKTKLLQILVNLLRNARDSVNSVQHIDKLISITIRPSSEKPCIELIVTDNGSGIPAENITRIFSLGFTTKSNGHGFGLHSSANAATELGGSLKASSEGIGKGATFIVEIPINLEKLENNNIVNGGTINA